GGNLWVASTRAATVTRIDQHTGKVITAVAISGNPQTVATVGEELWARTQTGVIVRIDARTNAVVASFEMADGQGRAGVDRLALSPAGVWVPGVALRLVDPATQRVLSERPIACYGVVDAGGGGVWVVSVA